MHAFNAVEEREATADSRLLQKRLIGGVIRAREGSWEQAGGGRKACTCGLMYSVGSAANAGRLVGGT